MVDPRAAALHSTEVVEGRRTGSVTTTRESKMTEKLEQLIDQVLDVQVP